MKTIDTRLMTKSEAARALLVQLFADRKRISFSEIVVAGAEIGVTKRTLQLARVELGIQRIHNGNQPGFWEDLR